MGAKAIKLGGLVNRVFECDSSDSVNYTFAVDKNDANRSNMQQDCTDVSKTVPRYFSIAAQNSQKVPSIQLGQISIAHHCYVYIMSIGQAVWQTNG